MLTVLFLTMTLFMTSNKESSNPLVTANSERAIKEKTSYNIVGIGDSLTVGTGDEENKSGYIGRLANMWEQEGKTIQLNNFAVKGQQSHKLLKQLRKKEVMQALEKADFIFVTIGANDFLALIKKQDFSVKRINDVFTNYIENLQHILQTIEQINGQAPIIFIGLYNPFGVLLDDAKHTELLIEHFNEISAETVQTTANGHFIPIHDIFLHKSDHLLADDYFHPNSQGYEQIAIKIFKYVKEREGIDGSRKKVAQ